MKAFTLIESIIAISVFCIGILTVLYGVSQTLRNQDYADVQIKSAFFAREGIELMFNLRDANYHKELPRNCIFERKTGNVILENELDNPFCKGFFDSGIVLKIGTSPDDEYVYVETGNLEGNFDEDFNNYQIYFHTGSILNGVTGFVYDYTGLQEEKTGFARYLVITGVVENGEIIGKDKLFKVESHVLYKKGALTGEKIMETFIGNYEF